MRSLFCSKFHSLLSKILELNCPLSVPIGSYCPVCAKKSPRLVPSLWYQSRRSGVLESFSYQLTAFAFLDMTSRNTSAKTGSNCVPAPFWISANAAASEIPL